MSIKFEHLQEDEILLIRTSGTFNLGFQVDFLKNLKAKTDEYNCEKILIDHRATKVVANTLSIFSRPKLYEELGIKRIWKAAMVGREVNYLARFYENTLQNRGWNVKVFDDYDAAVKWLIE